MCICMFLFMKFINLLYLFYLYNYIIFYGYLLNYLYWWVVCFGVVLVIGLFDRLVVGGCFAAWLLHG